MIAFFKIDPLIWREPFFCAIRSKSPECAALVIYLLSNPHANRIGLYYLPIPYLCADLGLSESRVKALLKILQAHDFCSRDPSSDLIWIKRMANDQFGPSLKPNDKNFLWLSKEWAALPDCPLVAQFKAFYGPRFGLPHAQEQGGKTEIAGDRNDRSGSQGKEGITSDAGQMKPRQDLKKEAGPSEGRSGGEDGTTDPDPPEKQGDESQKAANAGSEAGKEAEKAELPGASAKSPDSANRGKSRRASGKKKQKAQGSRFIWLALDQLEFEFEDLRRFYSAHARPEGRRAGFAEFRALRQSDEWPGLEVICSDVLARDWNPGFEPSLGRYLRDQIWSAPLPANRFEREQTKAAPRQVLGLFERIGPKTAGMGALVCAALRGDSEARGRLLELNASGIWSRDKEGQHLHGSGQPQ